MEIFDLQSILGFSAIVAVFSAIGGFIAEIAKSYLTSVVFAKWQEKQEAAKLFKKYKNPLALATIELANRLVEINKNYPASFLSRSSLKTKKRTVVSNSDSDDYYRKYKLISTLYRFCSLFGWLEIYRRDTVFLASGNQGVDSKIVDCVSKVRSSISDGHLNTFANWRKWKDHLIFREELRAVGETMVRSASSEYQVMGYADFERVLEDNSVDGHRWLNSTIGFFANHDGKFDFRRIRLCLMMLSLCELVRLLTAAPLSNWLTEGESLAKEILEKAKYEFPSPWIH